MSLRLRWFLLVGGLIAGLIAAQGWWVRQLTQDLTQELDRTVETVGRSMFHFFVTDEHHHRTHEEILHPERHGEGGHLPPTESRVLQDAEHVQIYSMSSTQSTDSSLDDPVDHDDGTTELPSWARMPASVDVEIDVLAEAQKTVIECRNDECVEKVFRGDDVEIRKLQPGNLLEQLRLEGGGDQQVQRRTWIQNKGQDAVGSIETKLSLHLEADGERPALLLAGPNVERRFAIPRSGFRDRLDLFSQKLVVGSLVLLILGLLLTGFLAHRISRPLERLADGAQKIGDGELGTQVAVAGGGEVAQAIGAFNQMSQQLSELDAKARRLSAHQHLSEIGEIARGLAHSLRNPLNALGLSVDELAAGASEGAVDAAAQERQELAEGARKQIRRIDQSIRSFLALASQGGGVLSSVDLGQLADDVALEALQDCRGLVRLEVQRADDGPLSLRGVEPELRAVLQALVVNAIEASPSGGRVTVRLESNIDGVRLTVDDDGSGLPEEVRRRLFTPHLSTKANGSGMGLFLAHRIACNRYGGHLQLIDRQPNGTRAELELGGRREATEDGKR